MFNDSKAGHIAMIINDMYFSDTVVGSKCLFLMCYYRWGMVCANKKLSKVLKVCAVLTGLGY